MAFNEIEANGKVNQKSSVEKISLSQQLKQKKNPKAATNPSRNIHQDYRNLLRVTLSIEIEDLVAVGPVTDLTDDEREDTLFASFNGTDDQDIQSYSYSGYSDFVPTKQWLAPSDKMGGKFFKRFTEYTSVGPYADLDWGGAVNRQEPVETRWADDTNNWIFDQIGVERKITKAKNSTVVEQSTSVFTVSMRKRYKTLLSILPFKTGLFSSVEIKGRMNGGSLVNLKPENILRGNAVSNVFRMMSWDMYPVAGRGTKEMEIKKQMSIEAERTEVLDWGV